jgi:hypothetical protein
MLNPIPLATRLAIGVDAGDYKRRADLDARVTVNQRKIWGGKF